MAKIFIFLLMACSLINIKFFFLGFPDLLLSAGLLGILLFKNTIIVPRYALLLFGIYIGLYIFSGLSGVSDADYESSIIFFGFLYKYCYIFGLFLLIQNCNFQIDDLNKIILFCWTAILLWTLYYIIFIIGDPLLAIVIPDQLSFPGTNTAENSGNDSHLFAYISGGLGLYLCLYLQNNFKYLIGFITLCIIVITGSRNPLALYGVLFFLFIILGTKKQIVYSTLGIAFGFVILTANFDMVEGFLPSTRSFNLNFLSDSSANNRIAKLIIAINEFLGGILILGQSVFASKILWADGIHTILLIHFGIFGLLLYLFILTYFLSTLFVRAMSQENIQEKKLLFFSCYVLFGLFITEFVLTSRGAVLALVPLFFLSNNSTINAKPNIPFSQPLKFL